MDSVRFVIVNCNLDILSQSLSNRNQWRGKLLADSWVESLSEKGGLVLRTACGRAVEEEVQRTVREYGGGCLKLIDAASGHPVFRALVLWFTTIRTNH